MHPHIHSCFFFHSPQNLPTSDIMDFSGGSSGSSGQATMRDGSIPVDGRNSANQLRLVVYHVYPIIYQVFLYILGGFLAGFPESFRRVIVHMIIGWFWNLIGSFVWCCQQKFVTLTVRACFSETNPRNHEGIVSFLQGRCQCLTAENSQVFSLNR